MHQLHHHCVLCSLIDTFCCATFSSCFFNLARICNGCFGSSIEQLAHSSIHTPRTCLTHDSPSTVGWHSDVFGRNHQASSSLRPLFKDSSRVCVRGVLCLTQLARLDLQHNQTPRTVSVCNLAQCNDCSMCNTAAAYQTHRHRKVGV